MHACMLALAVAWLDKIECIYRQHISPRQMIQGYNHACPVLPEPRITLHKDARIE
jgi:hypothetical protein